MQRPIATFDLTQRCPQRCQHCYYFADPLPEDELDDDAFLRRLVELRDRHDIRSAFWVGGEPLLRLELLRAAMRCFPRNAVATSAMVPVPTDLGCGLLVSLDGSRQDHDSLRGEGAFARALTHVGPLPAGSFAISTTLTAATLHAVDTLPELVETTGALGVLVGFYVGPPEHALRLSGEQREQAIDRLLALKGNGPDVLLNTVQGLERMRSRHAADLARECIYRERAIAFDTRLEPKHPCTFGGQATCEACGCPVVAEQSAQQLGHHDSHALLSALFPARA